MKKAESYISPGRMAFGFCLILLLVLAGEAIAKNKIASIHGGSNGVTWTPHGTYGDITLALAWPNGEVTTEVFPYGQSPHVSGPFEDGLYKYELTASPRLSPSAKEAMKAARASGKASEAKKLRNSGVLKSIEPQSGIFRITGGSFVPSDAKEGKE